MAKRLIYTVVLLEGDKVVDLKNGGQLVTIIGEMLERHQSEEGFKARQIYTLSWDAVEADDDAPTTNNSG